MTFWRVWCVVQSVLFMAGCAAAPYAEIGIGYQLDNYSDPLLHSAVPWTGKNPQAHFEVGIEFAHQFSCGWHHYSHYAQGVPFNDDPELFSNTLICKKHWGGR